MSSVEWPSVDAHNVSLPTIVSSTDLFDGEIFGDELIDIYNNSVHGDDHDNEIPQILPPSDLDDVKHHDSHPGVQFAATAAAIDDGLGAFRPSTSFSDLTTILNPSGRTKEEAKAKTTKKRAAAPQDAAANKRRATAKNTKKPVTTKKSAPASAAPAATKARPAAVSTTASSASEPADTPNPLSVDEPEVVAPKVAVANSATATAAAAASLRKVDSDDCLLSASSEADFKSIAQAAVSNLIVAAGSKKVEKPVVDPDEPVDTSTTHIKALTGNNWVAACAGASSTAAPVASQNDPKAGNRARRQNLTPDERARQNRDRNREHARNTRLRKKAYVEELKRTLTELVTQRDASDAEKRQSAQREAEQREVRFRVLEEFLKLRGRNEENSSRWGAILEDSFQLTLPNIEYRSTVPSGKSAFEQVLTGVEDGMADSAYLANFLQSLSPEDESVSLVYDCDRSNFFMDNCNAFLEWTASAVPTGKSPVLSMKGTVRGTFSPASNKLLAATLSFDTGMVSSQVIGLKEHTADVAASQADAILDSLDVPHLSVPIQSVSVVPPSCGSSSSDAKEDSSIDSREHQTTTTPTTRKLRSSA